jgi:hypothetical protein
MKTAKETEAVQVLKYFIADMRREGRVAYIDERTQRIYRQVAGGLVEQTSGNAHLFPEAAIWIPIAEAAP